MTTLSDTPGEGLADLLQRIKAFHDRDEGCNGFTADYEILRREIDEAVAGLRSPSAASDTAALPSGYEELVAELEQRAVSYDQSCPSAQHTAQLLRKAAEAIAALGRVRPVAALEQRLSAWAVLLSRATEWLPRSSPFRSEIEAELALSTPPQPCDHTWEKMPNDLVMWVCSKCREARPGDKPGFTKPRSAPQPALALIEELTGALCESNRVLQQTRDNLRSNAHKNAIGRNRAVLASAERFKGD